MLEGVGWRIGGLKDRKLKMGGRWAYSYINVSVVVVFFAVKCSVGCWVLWVGVTYNVNPVCLSLHCVVAYHIFDTVGLNFDFG